MRPFGHRDHTAPGSTGAARRLLAAATAAGLAIGLAFAPVATPAASAVTTCTRKPSPAGLAVSVTRARTALNAVVASVHHRKYDRAVEKSQTLRRQIRIARTKATSLIGKPPTDPESDEPPGPGAVQKVAGLEHQATMKLVPLFDHLRGRAVRPVGSTLNLADICRRVMLNKVIALRAGARDDYVDGLADTLPDYKKEVTALSTALRTSDLATRAVTSLRHARRTVNVTRHAMQKAFGGGERLSPGAGSHGTRSP